MLHTNNLPATLRTTNNVPPMFTLGASDDENTVHRRSIPDESDVVFDIAYLPNAEGTFVRCVQRYKLFRRTRAASEAIDRRKKLDRFGESRGTQGVEAGVSMVSHDEVVIEDPLSEDANKTGEERMIEKIKATVKQKGVHRAEQEADYDYDTFVSSRTSSSSLAARAQSASASTSASGRPSSTSRYANSPGRYRPTQGNSSGQSPARSRYGPSQGSGQGPSPGRFQPRGSASNPRQGGPGPQGAARGRSHATGGRTTPGRAASAQHIR
mmetsp:Transcript_13670/g.26420  ORF Transcript_13670/g.26420 Transcript_13670/m.26420 type:complete len:268 (+) Transcript_13670:488-1291(+)|eukprot:CAMPEP_0171493194 /NCGR_PEP_ID=MMETSP0958-20121227/4832_1 /TAXON_ID=87120 /ORGANISM="Aurantiochytrium limacinum, Strain ATCCMYA-1381" /LENGTH=267 /DNA_ID=CAMNT_0012026801 /DNA_START=381 /DNA_END=1184 /DNA_ORIENTATION=+